MLDKPAAESGGDAATVVLRAPVLEDGARLWTLVRDTGVLDLNSAYAYMMQCRNFPETTVVAETEDGVPAGMITAHILPARTETVFVWQVGVDARFRGQGLALRMLLDLLARRACTNVRYLETTISPSNEASKALFTALANRLETEITQGPCFPADSFPEGGHEAEDLYRIGPFRK